MRDGAFSSAVGRGKDGVGQGEDENPRGGPGRGKKHVNQLIEKFDRSA